MLGRLLANLLRSLVSGKGAFVPDADRPQAADPIAEYYFSNSARLINKWHHYFEIYHRHFEPFRGRSPVVVEVGVFHGGSLQMWQHYFGPGAHIVGIDVDARCKQFEDVATFEELYPHIQPNGIYLCEDIHTSFMPEYGGGYRREGTFLEYGKALIDRLYAWYSRDHTVLTVDEFTRATYALHFYDSVLVMEKRPIDPPQVSATGTPSF